MKKLLKTTLFIISLVILSSCGIHNGYLANSAALGSNNFNYVKKDLRGQAQTTYVFGFGGLAKQAIIEEAKRELLAGTELKANQALANVSVSWRTSYYFIAWTNKCTITADIVEFR